LTSQELIAAVEAALTALEPIYRGEATESDLYEASLFALVVQAAQDAGGRVLVTNDGIRPATALRFRRSPGNLWAGTFTYGVVGFQSSLKQLEAHLGIYVAGVSGVAHECDVALLDQAEANRSRAALSIRVAGVWSRRSRRNTMSLLPALVSVVAFSASQPNSGNRDARSASPPRVQRTWLL